MPKGEEKGLIKVAHMGMSLSLYRGALEGVTFQEGGSFRGEGEFHLQVSEYKMDLQIQRLSSIRDTIGVRHKVSSPISKVLILENYTCRGKTCPMYSR